MSRSCSSSSRRSRKRPRSGRVPPGWEARCLPAGIRDEVAPALVPPAAARVQVGSESRAVSTHFVDLRLCEAALADTIVQHFEVLPLPVVALRDPDVELEVERVVADRRPDVRPLEVHVPAGEAPFRLLPE